MTDSYAAGRLVCRVASWQAGGCHKALATGHRPPSGALADLCHVPALLLLHRMVIACTLGAVE